MEKSAGRSAAAGCGSSGSIRPATPPRSSIAETPPLLGAEFGAPNPQKVLQYMKLQGRDQVYLMSRFIGEEWEKALRELTAG